MSVVIVAVKLKNNNKNDLFYWAYELQNVTQTVKELMNFDINQILPKFYSSNFI